MTLIELTKKLVDLRKQIADADKEYDDKVKPLKSEKEATNAEILKALADSQQFSARFDFATVTRAVKKSLQIVDEQALVDHLKATGLEEYIKETVNELFDESKEEAVKQGIALPGTVINETEYVSVSKSDPEKDKRKVTTDEWKKNPSP